jgi:hypothetical protein
MDRKHSRVSERGRGKSDSDIDVVHDAACGPSDQYHLTLVGGRLAHGVSLW